MYVFNLLLFSGEAKKRRGHSFLEWLSNNRATTMEKNKMISMQWTIKFTYMMNINKVKTLKYLGKK